MTVSPSHERSAVEAAVCSGAVDGVGEEGRVAAGMGCSRAPEHAGSTGCSAMPQALFATRV